MNIAFTIFSLNIPETGFRTRWNNPKSDNAPGLCNLNSFFKAASESLLFFHNVVGRQHHNDRITITIILQQCR